MRLPTMVNNSIDLKVLQSPASNWSFLLIIWGCILRKRIPQVIVVFLIKLRLKDSTQGLYRFKACWKLLHDIWSLSYTDLKLFLRNIFRKIILWPSRMLIWDRGISRKMLQSCKGKKQYYIYKWLSQKMWLNYLRIWGFKKLT